MIRKILDDGRLIFGAVLFFTLIGNPLRVIIGEATKANAAPAAQVETAQPKIPANYKEELVVQEQEKFAKKLCSAEYEEVRAKIVYKALTSDVETPEDIKNYQAAIVILQVCPRNNVSY